MEKSTASRVVSFGSFQLDLVSGELHKHGLKIKLQELPFRVLALLLEHPGEVVTREELRKALWPDSFVNFDHSLASAINKIREALSDFAENARFIETLPRRGYRFIAPVSGLSGRPHDGVALTSTPIIREIPGASPHETPVEPSGPASRRTRRALWVGALGVAVLALLAVTYVMTRSRAGDATRPKIKSLAVLPLKNLSGDSTQEYLADGMTEALIGRLSRIHDLRVISRTSVMRFKDTHLSVPEIARTLRVDAIVEGSVIREGSRIRVSAQLIRGATDEHFWSEAYDRELRDVLALQSEVAQSIAGKVEVTVAGKEHERLTAVRSVSPEVYESYLKGRFALNKSNSKAAIEESIGYFEQAIKRDPTFASAYVGLASAHAKLSTVFIGAPPEKERPKAISAARKAVELDPKFGEAHLLLADMLQKQWQWAEAEAEYRRALDMNPSDAAAHAGLAQWLVCQGRTEEALAWARRGRELDPFAVSGNDIGWILFHARRYDEAIHELRSVLAVRPDEPFALWDLGFVLIANRQPEQAIPVLEKAVSVSDRSPGVIGVLIRAYAHAGRRTDALRLLAELKRRKQASYVPAGAFVNAYLGLGEYDQAFARLEQAYEERSNILQWLKVHPFFDPLRDDPRFAELVRRVGLD
jgi:TolB-like protein/DNA-binding winged helix-turn-helix (wHTH) protein/Flp pilus assembly protein TadD